MACETKLWLMLLLFAATCMQHCIHGKPQVPCLFIFGDSSNDPGNNNYLPITIKVNYPPYGVDFPSAITGRYNNGKTTSDFISELLDIPNFIPPNHNVSNILLGVNYASAGGGINDRTGSSLGQIFSLTDQINHHKSIFYQIAAQLQSEDQARTYLNQCLYFLDIGTNDYVNNYFVPDFYNTRSIYDPEEWAHILHKEYYQHLTVLHEFGARKFVLSGVGFLGCRPYQISLYQVKEGCVKKINDAVQLFNEGLRPLVDSLNMNYNDSKFIYVNYTAIQSSALPGLVNDTACCKVEEFYGLCLYNGSYCADREKYAFWDGSHTSEALNKIAAQKSYDDPSHSFTYPTDIKNLVAERARPSWPRKFAASTWLPFITQ